MCRAVFCICLHSHEALEGNVYSCICEVQLLIQVVFVSFFLFLFLCLRWVSFVSIKKLCDDAHADFDVTVSKVKKHPVSEVVVLFILSLFTLAENWQH